MDVITAKSLFELIRHGYRWLSNLSRAKEQRKQQSVLALRQVVIASRETAVYIRQLSDNGRRDHAVERHLATLWTRLGFALEDLGLARLAKRCRITGRHWAEPDHYDSEFLHKADVSLERMERLATEILHQIKH